MGMTNVEFDEIHVNTIRNVIKASQNRFGAKKEVYEKYESYINASNKEMLYLAERVFSLVKFANSIYPNNMYKFYIRELAQKMASAMCWSLLGHYQEVFRILDIEDDRYVNDIKHLSKVINLLKNWGKKDRRIYAKEEWFNTAVEESIGEQIEQILDIVNISKLV